MSNSYRHNCADCRTRCDGTSKGVYRFEDDTKYSEEYENKLINSINSVSDITASKTTNPALPDIEIRDKQTNATICYLEIKVQRRTFMAVSKLLPNADLAPSETVALNLSDLVRYIQIQNDTKIPILLAWVLSDRPCVLKSNTEEIFSSELNSLREILEKFGDLRRFRRKSGIGDIVAGQHKGVVVNYHFSLNELARGLDELIKKIKK